MGVEAIVPAIAPAIQAATVASKAAPQFIPKAAEGFSRAGPVLSDAFRSPGLTTMDFG